MFYTKLYGRGSADMKAGVAAIIVAISELNKLNLKQTKVQLQLVTDEEVGGGNCANYLTNEGYLILYFHSQTVMITIGYKLQTL